MRRHLQRGRVLLLPARERVAVLVALQAGPVDGYVGVAVRSAGLGRTPTRLGALLAGGELI